MSNELLHVARLALEGKSSDVRMYIAKLVRRSRRESPDFSDKLELLLKSNHPVAHDRVLREKPSSSLPGEDPGPAKIPFLKYIDLEVAQSPLLSEEIQQQLHQVLDERRYIKTLELKGLKPSSSLIFQGPPGVGKTISAAWMASQLKLPMYVLDLSGIMSSLLGRTGNNMKHVLDFARSHPCVLFLDEIDAIAKKRSDSSDVGELKRLVNVLLQELEDWPSDGLLIAATNHPELVDPALWRRFDHDITFSLPLEKDVHAAVVYFLNEDYEAFSPCIDALIQSLQGRSYSDIKRRIEKLRRLKVINPQKTVEDLFQNVLKNLESMEKSDRLVLALKLVHNFNYPKTKAAKLVGVSRDTLRRKLLAIE